jgi:homoserine O-succinyltransferase
MHQDIRPLRLLLLNLMPTKIVTETQLLRKLSNTPLQIEVEFLRAISHEAKNTDSDHLESFYRSYDEIRNQRYDGMIITGAPVEHLDFESVDYWPELCRIMEWTKRNVYCTLHICWGAQAALYHHYGVRKLPLPAKLFGVFPHRVVHRGSILFRGFDDVFLAPHSRHTGVRRSDIEAEPKLKILASSDEAGVYAVMTDQGRQVFITGHSEYDADTLKNEYLRDKSQGLDIDVPVNYFKNDDPTGEPTVTWRSHANLLYSNLLNYIVYQTTPYDITEIK